jgi:methionyl-tRNA formyltransferase
VTIHYINEKLDAGDIILQRRTKVTPKDNEKSLSLKNLFQGSELMIKAITQIENGTVNPISQNENKSSYYHKPRLKQRLKVKLNELFQ